MAAITDLSDLINKLTGGNSGTPEHVFFRKDSAVGASATSAVEPIAGRMTSLWEYNGSPSHGAAPGAVAVPTNATAGALKQTDPGGGRQKWLTGVTATSTTTGTLVLYDRLLHISGLSGTSIAAQAVAGTLDRYTSTESGGNRIWAEVYTQIGVTARTITASYTDQDGNTGQTTPATAIGGTGLREANRIIELPLASGDTGVRAVADVTLSASTGTTGNFGIQIVRPLLYIPLPILGAGGAMDLITGLPGLIEIKTDACLALAWFANGTGALGLLEIFGAIHTIEA